MMLFAVQSL